MHLDAARPTYLSFFQELKRRHIFRAGIACSITGRQIWITNDFECE